MGEAAFNPESLPLILLFQEELFDKLRLFDTRKNLARANSRLGCWPRYASQPF